MSLVRAELVCEVCLGVLYEPKTLNCAHSFCCGCLRRVLSTSSLTDSYGGACAANVAGQSGSFDRRDIVCPTCQKITSLPNGHVDQLPPSRLEKLLPVGGGYEELRRSTRAKRASSMSLSPHLLLPCSEHVGNVQEFYCAQCSTLVCGHCMLARHKKHIDQVKSAQEAQDKMVSVLRSLLQPSQETIFTAEEAAKEIVQLKRDVVEGSTATSNHIKQFFNQVRELLAKREALLVAKVDDSCVRTLSELTQKEEVVRKNVEALSRHTDQIRAVVQDQGDMSMLIETCNLTDLVEENQTQIQNVFKLISDKRSFAPVLFQSSDIDFSSLGSLSRNEDGQMGEAGYVFIKSTPPPLPPRVFTGDHPTSPVQDNYHRLKSSLPYETYTRAHVSSSSSEPLYEEPNQLMKLLRPHQIIRRNLSDSSIKKPGVMAELKYIIPCNTQASNVRPCSVAVGDTDAVIVSDIHNHCIKVFARSGKVVDTISDPQSPQQINSPVALASNSSGHVYILDKEGKKAIFCFKNGKFDSSFTSKASRFHKMGEPCGIAASDEYVYVTDWHNSCIHIFSACSGRYKESLGYKDGETSVLKHPMGIVTTPEGFLIVADEGSRCLWKITQMKERVEFQQIGSESIFDSPYGVAVTPNGFLIATDIGSSKVFLFSPAGSFIATIGQKGTEQGSFNLPRHLCVNSKGDVLVTDELNQRIQVFELKNSV